VQLTTDQQAGGPVLVANLVSPKPSVSSPAGYAPLELNNVSANSLALLIQADYQWLLTVNRAAPGTLTVASGAGVSIRETSGTMGLADITAPGDVVLQANGSILDGRPAGQTTAVIENGGNIYLASAAGQIGAPGDYLALDTQGVVTASARGDISIRQQQTLIITADSSQGQINLQTGEDLYLNNTAGSLVLGSVKAAGDIFIQAIGNMLPGSTLGTPANVGAQNITLSAGYGSIGTPSRAGWRNPQYLGGERQPGYRFRRIRGRYDTFRAWQYPGSSRRCRADGSPGTGHQTQAKWL
jgi:hypothetical protein